MNQQQLAANAGRQGQVVISDEFYVYSTGRPATAIAPAATQTVNIQIQADSDFLIEKLTFNADIAAAAQTASAVVMPNVNVLLTNTGNGRQLMNLQMPLTGLFGTAQLPFILPRQYLPPASSTLQCQLVSFEAAISPFITLNFIGRKIYWGPPSQ